MQTDRPPLSREIINLINDGSVFRQDGAVTEQDSEAGAYDQRTEAASPENLELENKGPVLLALDGLKRVISRVKKTNNRKQYQP